ncbi:hypothetical protein E3N88_00822 [Mikania micrantha]|uniref:Uncharacterized protein n=1 Tax=Mikania micrantha TaxID=192012 RepID=A0A5N6Q0W5_9ASTR|nr:hypothetical protein E3N88_00822 [Mikania micrantha]
MVDLYQRPYEASLFPGIGFGPFLRSLGGRRRRPPSGGSEPSVRYHSGRARILTLCQDVRAKGQSQVDSFYGALIFPKSSNRQEGLAPQCRLFATWGCSMFQGLGCSPIKAVRELGSERRETVRSISGVGVRALRGPFPSTRGPGRTHLWCTSYRAHEPPVAQPRQRRVLCPCGDGATEVLRIQEKVTARRAVYYYDRCQVEVHSALPLYHPRDGRAESFGVQNWGLAITILSHAFPRSWSIFWCPRRRGTTPIHPELGGYFREEIQWRRGGPVAQRIRARGYEPRCRGFESLLAHNRPKREGPFPLEVRKS